MADIAELFARLKNPNSPSPGTAGAQRQSVYQQPSVSSPIVSPPPQGHGLHPRHPDHILSANATPAARTPMPGDQSRSDQTASLLSLLTASSSTPSNDPHGRSMRAPESNAPVSASDLVASFARNASTPSRAAEAYASPSTTPLHAPQAAPSASTNPQDMLLTLLKRPESTSHARTPGSGNAENASPAPDLRSSNNATPVRAFGATDTSLPSSFDPHVQASKGPMFGYHNPFDSLPKSSANNIATHVDTVLEQSGEHPKSTEAAQRAVAEDIRADAKDVAEQAAQDVEQVIEKLQPGDGLEEDANTQLKDVVHEAAVELSEELRDGKTKHELEEQFSKPVVAALKTTAEAIADEGVADTWETADSEDMAKTDATGYAVQVYNLPMRPFVSLEVSGSKPPSSVIRPDVVMKIASLKKEFDQVDRTLATASQNHIVYAMAKGGGFRVIRQDDGSNKTAYRHPDNQIFNISINSSPSSDFETVLATGVNGSVFWSAVSAKADITTADLEKRSFVFPPPPSPDENTSTAQLKTRAKKSSRHPAFFAYGRSKTIYLVWPHVAQSEQYMENKDRVVDSVKYLNDRCVRIATGKAGKDFAFSEDDTVIVSLDKHGKLKFWDIAEHIHPEMEFRAQSHVSTEVREPAMTLWVSSNSQRAWPTSVNFVDKDRPTTKGLALRYMLVGLKQNHTIQLWDLGLGKAVQELNLPHENETDAICSISYHSKSGVIAVGHPTRNSIYLIHLSAPKYNLPQLTQAKFVRALANKEKGLPRPESTAIMSGLREISLGPIGALRSIDVISPTQPAATEERSLDDETVFEVYAMHSKGVTCLNFKRRDLGWGRDGKVVNARDAEQENIVVVSELQTRSPTESGEPEDTNSKASDTPSKTVLKTAPKAEVQKESEAKASAPATPARGQEIGAEKADKKKKTKRAQETGVASSSGSVAASKPVDTAQPPAPAVAVEAARGPSQVVNGTDELMVPIPPAAEAGSAGPNDQQYYINVLNDQLKALYRRVDEDKRVLDATGSARQEAVLRLVSSTLTDNVEKSLSQIVSASIQESVLPSISQVTASTLDQKLGQIMSQQLGQAVPREIKAALPDVLGKTLQSPQILQNIANAVSGKIVTSIEKHVTSTLQTQMSAVMTNAAAEAAVNATREVNRRMDQQMHAMHQQSAHDAVKIDKLSQAIGEMTETMTTMATIQAGLQREMMLLRSEVGRTSEAREAAPAAAPERRDPELESIAEDMEHGRLEQGTIKWLQSQNQDGIFTRIFRKLDPTYLREVNQIVVLSVAAAVSQTLTDGLLAERLGWLEVSLAAVDAQSAEIANFAPKMMDILIDRLSEEYMRLSDEGVASARVLSRIHTLVRRAKEIKAFTAME